MLGKIIGFFTSKAFSSVTDKLTKAYELKLKADTDEKKLEAETLISQLKVQQEIILAEQGKWYTAWIRPLLALPVVIYVWKIIVYDTVLGLGVTPNPGDIIQWIVVTIIGAYFVTRPFEKIFRR